MRDFIGPTPYGGGSWFWVDPKNPRIVNSMGCRFQYDPAAKTFRPLAILFRRADRDQPFVPNGHCNMGNGVRPIVYEGKEYLMVNGSRMVQVLMRRGDAYVPVAAVGCNNRWVTR